MKIKSTSKRILSTVALSVLTVSALSVVQSVKADTYYNPSTSYNRYGVGGDNNDYIENTTVDGNHLNYNTNFELFNFKWEYKRGDGSIVRYWEAKKDASVIQDESRYSLNNINRRVYDFDSYGYQLPEGTDFSTKTFIGEQNVDAHTVYRYWK